MSEYFDTYFFDSTRAKKIAKQHNPINNNKTKIQLCYHPSSTTKENLIGVPIVNFQEYFLTTKYRFPTHVDFIGSEYENKEEEQDKIIKIFYTIFQEISKEKSKYTLQLQNRYNNLSIKNNKSIGFIASKIQPKIVDYLSYLEKEFKNEFQTSFLTQQCFNKNMILKDITIDDLYTFIIDSKPKFLVFYNEFYPQFIHNDIVFIYIVDSFKICESILEYKLTSKNSNNNMLFFTTSKYYSKMLDIGKIDSTILPSYFSSKFIKKNKKIKKRYNTLLIASYQNLDKYYIFHKMFKKVDKYLKKHILYIKDLIVFIDKAKYPIKEDWELNLYLQQTCIINHIVKHTSIKLNIDGTNWDKLTSKHKIIKKSNIYEEKLYQQSNYVIVVSYTIDNKNILNIIQNGAIPVVYDLRKDDTTYNKQLDDYCLFFKNITELDNIINSKLQPKKVFDQDIYNIYSFSNIKKIILKKVLSKFL